MTDATETTTTKPPPRKRVEHWLLLSLFVGLIFAVPISQAIIDKVVEEEDKPLALTLFDKAPAEEHLREFEKLLEESSYYEQKLRPLLQYYRYRGLKGLGEKALGGQAPGWYFYTPGVRYLVEPYFRELTGERAVAAKDDPVAAIKDFAAQLKKRGIELLVFPIPGKASVYPDKLVSSVPGPSPAISGHTLRFVNELKKAGLNTLDLNRLFSQRRKQAPKQQLYMKGDTHWTGDGVRLVAAELAAWVKKRPWFAAAQKARGKAYTRKKVWVDRAGDVPEMTKIPHRDKLFGTEKVVAYKVATKDDGEDYEDPEEYGEAPILMLGDSFSRVFQTDEPEAAGMIANLAYELQLPLGSVVNDGGASTLVRQALARDLGQLEGKKLVIWSFVERDIRFGRGGWQKFPLDTPAD